MLEAYPKSGSQKDSLREILQEAALLGLSRHQFFEHAVFYGGTALIHKMIQELATGCAIISIFKFFSP